MLFELKFSIHIALQYLRVLKLKKWANSNFEKGYDNFNKRPHSQEIPKPRVLKPLTWWA